MTRTHVITALLLSGFFAFVAPALSVAQERTTIRYGLDTAAQQGDDDDNVGIPNGHVKFSKMAPTAAGAPPGLLIMLDGAITPKVADTFVTQAEAFAAVAPPNAPVRLVIDSEGGMIASAHKIVGEIGHLRNIGHPVTTVSYAKVASAANFIFLAGSNRVLGEDAEMMIHGAGAMVAGMMRPKQIHEMTKKLDEQTAKMIEWIVPRTHGKLTAEIVNEKLANGEDWHVKPSEAIEYGLADQLEGASVDSAAAPIIGPAVDAKAAQSFVPTAEPAVEAAQEPTEAKAAPGGDKKCDVDIPPQMQFQPGVDPCEAVKGMPPGLLDAIRKGQFGPRRGAPFAPPQQ